jgi:stearoyl-CoA desaturase (delta-9 desaturase)
MTTTTTTTPPETTTSSTPESAGIAWPALLWVLALHAGALLAFVPAYFSWPALLACVVLHWFTGGIGICMTYHRLLTHRSFVCRPKFLEYVLTAIGCSASEGGAIGWVADHRKHHAYSDQEEDVHTPKRGFGWAHMFWWMTPDITSMHNDDYVAKWAPDLQRDPVHRFLDRFHWVFPITSAVLLYWIGARFFDNGMSWLVWGFFVRSITVQHATWLVNSATHVWGYRTYQTRDHSTNLWWVALLTYGEGWHNNHHAFQTSARHGFRWWEIDMTYYAIRTLEFFGLAHSVKHPRLTKAAKIVAPTAPDLNAPGLATATAETAPTG